MRYTFQQGWLDSLCGIYSIVNAERLINNSSDDDSQRLFNEIVRYLSKKRQLRDSLIEGTNHRIVMKILDDVVGDRIPVKITNRKNITTISCWWEFTREYLTCENRAVILSLDGREEHFTVIKSITDKIMNLSDSGGIQMIRKSACKLKGYIKEDKYVIFPSQCIYLGKD